MNRLTTRLTAAACALVLTACSSGPDTAAPSTTPGTSAVPGTTVPPTTGSTAAEPDSAPSDAAAGTPITITVGDTVLTATLNDAQVSQDFLRTLPATLPWFRNADIEYITELPAPLTETGPFYTDVQPGDLVYYNPRDSITIIYEETSSVPTLTLMGRITSDLEPLRGLPDDVEMVITRGEQG